MLALKNVSKTFGSNRVLASVSFDVRPKDNMCIVGEGGSGKSTLLKLMVRTDDPTTGTVQVDGIDLKRVPPTVLQLYRRRLGISFQEPMLLMHATAEENIALPLELFGVAPAIIKRTTDDLLKRMNLLAKARTLAQELSQSERALVGIARAIVTAPMIVIADEPLLHLDPAQAKIVVDLLKNMHKHGTTLVLFSRSAEVAKAFGARAVHLKDGKTGHERSTEKTPERKQPTKADTHRILEEEKPTAKMVEPLEDEVETTPKTRGNDGKKIRITSIGSGL